MVNKKILFFLTVSFILLNFGVVKTSRAEDKFGQMINSVKEKIKAFKIKKDETDPVCHVSGISCSGENSSAIINGKTYFINEKVCGGTIVEINPSKVIVSSGGRNYEFRVGEARDVKTKNKIFIGDDLKFEPFKKLKDKLTFKKKQNSTEEENPDFKLWQKLVNYFKSFWKKKYPIGDNGNFIKVPKVWKFYFKEPLVFNVKPEDNPYGDFEAVVTIFEYDSLDAKDINEWISHKKEYKYLGNSIEKQGHSTINMATFIWRKIKGNNTMFQYFTIDNKFVYEINVTTDDKNIPAIKLKFDRIVQDIGF